MGNEVSAQRVTFGFTPPCPLYTQVQQEASLNTDAPSTKKRKREDSEEDYSRENVRKRRKLLIMEDGINKIKDSSSSFQSVCQNRKPEVIEECGASSTKAETSDTVLNRLVIDMNRQKQEKKRQKRLRRQWAKSMDRKPGRDPIGTPFFSGLHATTPILPSTESELTAAGTNQKSKIKESSESTVEFGSKASPDMNASTSSAAEKKDQVFVKLKLPKEAR
ncbi:hypothetical protein BGAL_0102g00070 [Botrytis galanthina]|uniref:Uncharacterized protein n=1 Tax=Botrytis galanthina TaxID=278940 RepID=A0A4S8R1K0_9HELO|nr:hypothetical protein BGAL_0102g00070 [Botrytis galanthina]